MLSIFGKTVRKLRIDRNMNLSYMAKELRLSATYITAVETGRKAVPEGLTEKIIEVLNAASLVSEPEKQELYDAAEASQVTYKVDARLGIGVGALHHEVAALFARNFRNLSDTQLQNMLKVLDSSDDSERQRA